MVKAPFLAAFMAFGGLTTLAMARVAEPTTREDSTPAQPTTPWFVLATKLGECRPLLAMFEVETPEAVMALFADVGHPLEVTGDKGDYVLLKLAGDPSDPGMALVRGAGPCRDFLLKLQVRGK